MLRPSRARKPPQRNRKGTRHDRSSVRAPPARPGAELRFAIAFLVFLALAGLSYRPAHAVKLGTGADDAVAVPTFADVAAYNANDGINAGNWVRIGSHTLPNWVIWRNPGDGALTADKLIATYADTAAYLADAGRANRVFAVIDGDLYAVHVLEALHVNRALTDSNLPDAIHPPNTETVALGDNARAKAFNAIAVGYDAEATVAASTALGTGSSATGDASTAVGYNADARGWKATAVGEGAR